MTIFLQLIDYGRWWLLFGLIAFVPARLLGYAGMIGGHLANAVIIVFLDLSWIQSQMHQPGWDGQPDLDIVFIVGLLIRIVLFNLLLLPAGIIGVRYYSRVREKVA